MKYRLVILQSTPCRTNLYPDGPDTVDEAEARGADSCPRLAQCQGGYLDMEKAHGCTMLLGHQLAMQVLRDRTNLGELRRKLHRNPPVPPLGFISSDDRRKFTVIRDFAQALPKIIEFAAGALVAHDAANGPAPGPSFNQVVAHAMQPGGALSLSKLQALEGRYGWNGGQGCDTYDGFCSCGAHHGL